MYATPLAKGSFALDGSNQHSSGSWKKFAAMRIGEVLRIVRLGYSLLHTDVDVVFLRNPAPYLMCSGASGGTTRRLAPTTGHSRRLRTDCTFPTPSLQAPARPSLAPRPAGRASPCSPPTSRSPRTTCHQATPAPHSSNAVGKSHARLAAQAGTPSLMRITQPAARSTPASSLYGRVSAGFSSRRRGTGMSSIRHVDQDTPRSLRISR